MMGVGLKVEDICTILHLEGGVPLPPSLPLARLLVNTCACITCEIMLMLLRSSRDIDICQCNCI